MKINILDTKEQIGEEAAILIAKQVRKKPDSIIGFATGASPIPTYQALIKMYESGKVSFKDMATFNLDEYCGLPREDKNSYFTFMHEMLFDHIDVKAENTHFFDGNAPDPDAECKVYDALISENGGIDLQILGIGNNGHIGFNEPADMFPGGSYKVKITKSTQDANKIYFEDGKVPQFALTMGVGSICRARHIILIATGSKKAQAIHDMLKRDITPRLPASILQRHDDVNVFLDREAAALL